MMSDLIRMSLFCDMTEMIADNKHHLEQVVDDSFDSPQSSPCPIDTKHCLTPPSSVDKPEQIIPESGSDAQTEPKMTQCNGGASLENYAVYNIKLTVESRVSLSAFESFQAPEDTFAENYLRFVVPPEEIEMLTEDKAWTHTEQEHMVKEEKEDIKPTITEVKVSAVNEHVTPVTNEASQKGRRMDVPESTRSCYFMQTIKLQYGEKTIIHPPYLLDAMAVAAIFLSGQPVLCKRDVTQIIQEMFDVFHFKDSRWQKRWRKYVLNLSTQRRKRIFYRQNGKYGVDYSELDVTMFYKTVVKDCSEELAEPFASDLFTELGIPEKFEELKRRIVTAEIDKCAKRNADALDTKEVSSDTVDETKLESMESDCQAGRPNAPKKRRTSLALPPRPCFADENSNDSLHLADTNPCLPLVSDSQSVLTITTEPQTSSLPPSLLTVSNPCAPDDNDKQPLIAINTVQPIANTEHTHAVFYLPSSVFGSFARVPIGVNGLWV